MFGAASYFVTVISTVSVAPFAAVAVMVALPSPTAVIVLPETLATLLLELV